MLFNRRWRWARGSLLAGGLAFLLPAVAGRATLAGGVTATSQPTSGPGGADYSHRAVVANVYGDGAAAYWIFEPADPRPDRAPLIVFNHGWSAMQPATYGAWIDHLVRRGNIVVYPVYQADLKTPAPQFTANAIAAVKEAIHRLQTEPGHVRPDLDKFAIAGHSMGGVISANMAALAGSVGLPRPRAVMCVEPGKTWGVLTVANPILENLSLIPPDTLLLAVAGDSDNVVKDVDAKRIYYQSTRVRPENKNFVLLISDDHGSPALKANHMAPVAPNLKYFDTRGMSDSPLRQRLCEWLQQNQDDPDASKAGGGRMLDNLDYFGTWKLLDGLTDAAFFGKNRNYALGNTPEQRYMGQWSDGTPVKELQVLDKP